MCIHKDIAENTAFLAFTSSFSAEGLNVLRICLADKGSEYYIIEDLGDKSFHEIIMKYGFEDKSIFYQINIKKEIISHRFHDS